MMPCKPLVYNTVTRMLHGLIVAYTGDVIRAFRLYFLMLLLPFAGASCGFGIGGNNAFSIGDVGGGAAPTGIGGTPVAVEVPALGSVSDLPFASGIVMGGSGSISAPLKSVNKSVAITGTPFTSATKSYHACKMFNSTGLMMDAILRSDVNTCILQAVATQAKTAGVNLYSGSDVIYSVNTNSNTEAPSKFKVNITRNSSNVITQSKLYACNSSPQQNVYQAYQISGNDVSIYAKGYDPVSNLMRSLITVEGTVSSSDTTQFVDSKTGTFRFYGDSLMTGATTGTGIMTQYPSNVVVNTLFIPGGSQHLVGSADFTNTTSGATFDPLLYQMGAGAATFTQYDVTTTGCWDGTLLLPVTCLASNSNYVAMAAKTATTPDILYDIYGFGTGEQWDCLGTDSFTISDYDTAVNSCIARFTLDWSETDCSTLDTNTTWLVQATDGNGTNLSTTEGTYTNVTTGAGGLYISSNWATNTSTFNDTTIQLIDLTTNTAVDIYGETWNSTNKELFVYYGYTNHNYKLTITGGASGIKSASGSTLPASKVYYFMVNGGYQLSWSVLSFTPLQSATGVAVSTSSFPVTFSQSMSASTITTSTLLLSCITGGEISGTVAAAQSPANTYTFTANTTLSPLDSCSLAVAGGSNGIKDSDGDTNSQGDSAAFQTGCTTNDNFTPYSQSLTYSNCWTGANITSAASASDYLPLFQNASASGADAPRHSKTFGNADITTTIEIASAEKLSDTGDSCGMRIMDPASNTTGAIITVKADGSGNIVVEKITAADGGSETYTFVTSASSFPGRSGSNIYLRLTQAGGSTTASYRVGNSGDFTTLGSALSVSFGPTKRLDLFVTSDGSNDPVGCYFDNFTTTGASAVGQD